MEILAAQIGKPILTDQDKQVFISSGIFQKFYLVSSGIIEKISIGNSYIH